MLELHEQVERHWDRRRATSCHWLFVAVVPEGCLVGTALSMVVVVPGLVAGSRQVEVLHRQDSRYMSEVAVEPWEAVQLLDSMGLSVVGQQLGALPQVAGFVTSSRLILRLLEEAGCLVVLERRVVDSRLAVRLATLRQGRALAFEHMTLEAHQPDRKEPAARSHRLAVAEPWPRCKSVAAESGIQRAKEEVLRLRLPLQMRRKHDEP
jgi:hypothetical protein